MSALRWTVAGLFVSICTVFCHGEFLRVCYMTNWSQYRGGEERFTVSSISDVSLCSHIILAFAGINTTHNTLAPLEWNDDTPRGTYQQLAQLRDSNPGLKILLAVGGWNLGSDPFVQVISNGEKRNAFADNVITFIRRLNFDGVDFDWEWPAQRGSGPGDKERFTALLKTLREKITVESRQTGRPALLLTLAVAASQFIIDAGYEVDKISSVADFLSIMTYDMDVSRGPRLMHHSPLYSRPGDTPVDSRYNVEYTVNYWLNKGAPRTKVIVGIPFYGRSYRLFSPDKTDLYDEASGSSSPEAYYQICQYAQNASWTRVWDNASKVPAIYNKDKWIGYDDTQSMESKAMYIRQKRLGGAMVWDIGQDDFGNFCNQGRFPLLNKLAEVLSQSNDDCEPGTYGSVSATGCTPCSKGSYQPGRRSTGCKKCIPGTTTYSEGAKEQYRCVEICAVGYEYNYLEEKCMKCRLGFTRSQLSSAYCVQCPTGYTTMTAGDNTCVPLPDGVPAPEIMDLMYHFTLTFTTTTCDNKDVIVGAIGTGVRKVMSDASTTWPEVCSRGCDNVKTVRVEGCDEEWAGGGGGTLRLTVRALIEEVPEVLRSAPDKNGVTVTRPTDSVVTELFFDKTIFNTLGVYDIQYTGMTERTMEMLCSQTGYVFSNGQCIPCPAGTFKQTTTRRCIVCPVGKYQDKQGQTECVDCPGPMTTLQTGSGSLKMCLSPCAVDVNYCENNGVCQWRSESLKVFCQCLEPYFGERCDLRADQQKDDLGPIIGGVVGGLGSLILIIVVMVICCSCCRRGKSRGPPSVGDHDDVVYVSSVMTNDFHPTRTVITTDPFYYDNAFVMADNYRTRERFRTPTVVQLDSDSSPSNEKPRRKTDRKTSANGVKDGDDIENDNPETSDENQPTNNKTTEEKTVDVVVDDVPIVEVPNLAPKAEVLDQSVAIAEAGGHFNKHHFMDQDNINTTTASLICSQLWTRPSYCKPLPDSVITDKNQCDIKHSHVMKGNTDWCPEKKGFRLLSDNGPCVKFHTDRKTWPAAQRSCQTYSANSRLVVLDNPQKNALVKAAGIAITDQLRYGLWIGLFEDGPTVYRWVDGTEVSFTDWGKRDRSAPRNEDCVRFHRQDNWTWMKDPCTRSSLHYICEIVITSR